MTDEDAIDELGNMTRCPGCNTRQQHSILKEKILKNDAGIDYLLKCEGCGNVHTVIFRTPKSVNVRFTLSDGPDSHPFSMEIDDDEVFVLNDEFEAMDMLWRITRLEVEGDDKPRSVEAKFVGMVWATRVDLVRIKRTFSDGDFSFSDTIDSDPENVFNCGTTVHHRGEIWRIRALHSGTGRTLTGKMKARDIRRIFLLRPQTEEELAEYKKRERGNWKGQEFPGREEHQQKWRDDDHRFRQQGE
ncbi:MAG: HVO_0476 family zinc finger protein [Candidatus Thalassarchaeaceae archaeon]|jgi:uncharacterized Zn finger protein|nr:HVO_0476 family zinc finger protein [Candidatus Thalassarchaeaceae archaeon]